jgi:hypothetical protein
MIATRSRVTRESENDPQCESEGDRTDDVAMHEGSAQRKRAAVR